MDLSFFKTAKEQPTGIPLLIFIKKSSMAREMLVQFPALPEGIQNSHFSPDGSVPQPSKYSKGWEGIIYFLSFERDEEIISGSVVWAEWMNTTYVSDSENTAWF